MPPITASSRSLPTAQGNGPLSWSRVPQKEGTFLTLHGRDALMLTADQRIGGHEMYYTTSQLFAAPVSSRSGVLQYLVGASGDDGETVLHYDSEPAVEAPDGVEHVWDGERGELRLNYRHLSDAQSVTIRPAAATARTEGDRAETDPAGHGEAASQPLTLRVIDRQYAQTVWVVEGNRGDGLASTAVEGAHLATAVRYRDGLAEVYGSMTQGGQILLTLPEGVDRAQWNGGAVVEADGTGLVTLDAPGPVGVGDRPLTFVKAEDDAAAAVGYDDSGWVAAKDTVSRQAQDYPGIVRDSWRDRNQQGPGESSGVVLDSNHYGFYSGSVWYRAHFTAADGETIRLRATASRGAPQQGRDPGFAQVWVNGQYAGAVPAVGEWAEVSAPAGSLTPGQDAVVAVLVHNLGLSVDWSDDGQSKQNRGLYDAVLPAAGEVSWRIWGAGSAQARDAATNPTGTAYNNGGLLGEQAGWHMPALDDSGWQDAQDLHADRAGINWYRAHVDLDLPQGQETAFRLDIKSSRFAERADHSQATLFVNGWNTGVYIGDAGPQWSYAVPAAFLNAHGDNVIALAVAAKGAGDGPESVLLRAVRTRTVAQAPEPDVSPEAGVPSEPGPDASPEPGEPLVPGPDASPEPGEPSVPEPSASPEPSVPSVPEPSVSPDPSVPLVPGPSASSAPEGTDGASLPRDGARGAAPAPAEAGQGPRPDRERGGSLARTGTTPAVLTVAGLLCVAGIATRRRVMRQ